MLTGCHDGISVYDRTETAKSNTGSVLMVNQLLVWAAKKTVSSYVFPFAIRKKVVGVLP